MNKIFKVIWNHATQSWVAVSELQKAKGKTASRTDKRVLASVLAATLAGNAAYAATTIGSNDQNNPNNSQNTATLSVIKDKTNQRSVFIWDSGTEAGTGRSTVTGIDAVAIGSNLNMTGAPSQSVIIGSSIVANDTHQAVAVGNNINITGRGAVAIGGDDIGNPSFTFAGSSQNLKAAMLAKYNNSSEWRTLSASGAGAVVLGSLSVANGDLATVVGAASNATAFGATAVGGLAKSDANFSFAGGFNSTADSEASIAIGKDAKTQTLTPGTRGTDPAWSPKNGGGLVNGTLGSAVTIGQIAIGQGATTLAGSTLTVDGRASISSGQHAIAIGSHARTTESMDIAIGAGANVERKFTSGPRALHSGYTGVKNGTTYLSSMALGFNANSGGSHGDVIIGAEASSAVNSERAIAQATAIGSRAKVYGDQALAIGADTLALGHSSISIGGDDITLAKTSLDAMATGLNMAAFTIESLRGSASTNHQALFNQPNAGVEKYPNTASIGDASVAVGPASQSLGVASVAMGVNSLTYGTSSVALGTFARSGNKDNPNSVQNTIAIGTQATASNKSAIAIGLGSNASGSQSIAVGVGNQVSGDNSGAFGDPNTISGNNSYAVGNDNTISTADSFVLGNNVTNTVTNSVFVGTGSNFTAAATTDVFTSTTEATGTTAGLNQVSGAKVNGIEYGGFAGSTAEGVVSVGTANNERRIQGVAAGLISAGSTDAINGSQLYAVADKLNKKNYFHTNPSDNEALQGGANNLDVVDGVGSATGGKAIAAGVDAAASGKSAVAMGRGATADSLANIAIGEAAQAVTADKNTGAQDGKKDESDGVNKAIAIGASAKALNAKTIAVGDAANASGKNSSAIGSQANVSGEEATGIGTAVTASGNYSTAIGQRATATERLATAIGSLSKATGEEAVAIGRDALSGGTKTVAIGSNSVASGSETVAMGSGANSSAFHSVAISTGANATANQAIAIGRNAKSHGASSIAIGDGAQVNSTTATNSVAIGQGANATAASATAVGRGAAATGTNAFAGGREAKASQTGAVAMGYNATASQVNAIAIGTDASATQTNAVALGRSAAATLSGSVALGVNATTSASVAVPSATVNGITYSGFAANTTVEPGYVVSVGKAGAERQIQNVAAGQITATSTDAINGSQLYMTNQVLGNLANATVSNFGGNATLNKSGDKAGDITFTNIGNTGKETIHDAIAAVKENVVAGTNIVSVTSQADTTTGATTYTVNAKGTTASSANQNYVTVTPGQPSTDNVTDYAIDLSDTAKASLAKADTAVQNIASPDGSVIVSKAPNDPNTTNLQVNRGTGISLDANGRLTVTKTTLVQGPDTMQFAAPRGQTNNFVNAGDLADHLNKAGFKLAVGKTGGGVSSDTASAEEAKRIRTGETLTMTAGKGMNIKQVDHGYEFSVDSAEVGVVGNKATVPADSDNKMATVGSVAKAINESGFTLKTSANGGEKLTSSNEEVINPADAVEMIAGKNLTVQQGENGKITYATKDDVTFNSVTANNTTTNNLKVNPNGNVDMGGNQITNVASGGNVDDNAANIGDVKTAVETAKEKVIAGTNIVNVVEGKEGERTTFTVNAKGTTASSANEDYVTVKADPTDGNNVTNYKVDLGQKAKDSLAKADTAVQNFKVTVNGADVQTVANGDTVKFVNGTGTTARNTSGQITFDINKSTLTTDTAGNVTNNNKGDTFVTGDDVAKAINEATARTEKTTTVVKGSNTHVKAKEVGNNTEYTVSADKATVSVSGALTKTETPTTDATTGAVTTDYALDLSQTTKDDIKKGVDAKDTVDNKGLTFTGDSGSTNVEKLGSTVAVNGDTNIATSAQGDQITIKLKDDITVNSVTANATTTTNLTVKPNGNVNMGGNKITNVAKGEADTDAVNVSQLNEKLGNSAWNLKVAQDTAAAANVGDGKINGDNTVTFTGKGAVKVSTTTSATEANNYGVDIALETQALKSNADGKVETNGNSSTGGVDNTAPNTTALATAGDVIEAVNNSFWKVFQGDATAANKKDNVKAGDNVVFANGTGTVASVETSTDSTTTTVKYNANVDESTIKIDDNGKIAANTGDLNNNTTTGKVTEPTGDDAKKLTTAGDVAEAINNAGFRVKSAGNNKATGDNAAEELVKTGDLVEFEAGENLTVKREGKKFTYATAKDVVFDTVKAKNSLTIGDGTTATVVTPNASGLNFATNNKDSVLTGLSSGLTTYTDAPKNGLVDLNKPTNGTAPTVADNTVATVGDLRNMGWVVSSDKTTDALTTPYNAQVKNANEVKFVGSGLATVSGKTDGDVRTITVDVNAQNTVNDAQLPVVYTKADGTKVVKAADGKFYPADKVNQDGSVQAGATEVPASEVIASLNNGNNSSTAPSSLANVKSNLTPSYNKDSVKIGTDGKPTADTAGTVNTSMTAPTAEDVRKMYNNAATVGDVLNAGWNLQENNNAKDFVKAYDTVNFVNGSGTTAKVTMNDNGTVADVTYDVNTTTISQDANTGKAKADPQTGKTGDLFATASSVVDAINKVALKFSGDVKDATTAENTFKRENQDEAKIIGGVKETAKLTDNNIGVVSNGSDTLTVKLAKDITVDSVTTGNTKVDTNGVTIKDPAAPTDATKTVSLTDKGLNNGGKQITNVASGGDEETNGANIGDIKRLINSNGGFRIVADNVTGTITKADGDKVETNGLVKFTDSGANNIVTTVKDNEITFGLNKDVTIGNETNGGSVTLGGNDGVKIVSTPNATAGGKPTNTISNLTGNLAEVSNTTTAQPDANKPADLADKKNNAATLGDVLNAGWNLQGNGKAVDTVVHNDTVDFINGKGTTVTVEKDANGKNTIKVDSPIEFVNENINDTSTPSSTAKLTGTDPVQLGNVASGVRKDGVTPATPAERADAISKATGNALNNAVNVGDLQAATNAAKTEVESVDGSVNIEERQGDNGQTIYDLSVNKSGLKASDDKKTVSATKAGNAFATAEDVANAINTAAAAATTEVTSENGSITVTESRGDNGQNIYDLEVTKATLSYDNNGKVVSDKDGDAFATGKNVADMINNAAASAKTEVTGSGFAVVTEQKGANGQTIYNVDVAKADAPTFTDGKVEVKPADEDKVMSAGDVVNAINNSGWNLAAGTETGSELIKPSDKVTFKAGSTNLTVKREGADITYDLAKDINVNSVTSNTITVPTDAANPTNNPITINKDGINAGNKTISNVAGNLADASTATSQPDANSLANLADKKNNAATVGDVLNAGWNLQGNGKAVDTVTHNDTVDFVNGKGTVVTVEKKDGKNIIKVDSPIEFVNTDTNDTSTPSNTAKLTGDNPVQLTNVASGLRQAGGTAPTGKDLADAIKNASGSTLNNAVNVGDLKAATDAAKTEVKGTGLATVAAPTIGDNGQAIYTVDVAKADAPTVTRGSVTVKAGDENKVMVAGDVAKAITDSEKTSSVKAGSSAVTVTEGAEDANGNTEYTVDVATDKTIARDKDGKLTVNTGSSLKVDGTTGKIDVNTDGTTITTDPATGAVKANTTALTNDDKGKVNTPAVPNALATAGDIANAINNSGFTLKTSANGGSKVSGADEVINPGETIDMAAGKNLTVTQDANGKVTYATAEEVSFTTVNSTTVVVGNPADPNNSTTLTSGNGGLNVGGDKITGVAEGDITPTSKDAVNGSQIFALTGGAKTTIGDVTVTNPDGSTTTYKNVVLDENGNPALVTYNVKTQGEHITNSVITAINNMNTQGIKFFHTNDGKADSTRPSDQRYNTEDSSASGRYASAVGYQAEASGESSVAMGNNATASGANAIAIGVNSQATGKNTISIGNGNIVTGENSGAFGDPSKIDATNSYSVGNNNEIAAGQTDVFALGNNVKATVSNSVFLGSESGVFDQANASRDTTTGVHIATASSNYTYRGENDANVAGVADAVGVVSVGNATSTRQVQGVAAGVVSATSTDAINGSQLFYTNKAIGDLQGDVYKLGNTVNKMNRNLRAGIAGANAAAGLPQVYIPGKSMVAASAGTYKGEGALAVGYSRASDNGKLILKLQGNTNTRGEVGASVGVGYQW